MSERALVEEVVELLPMIGRMMHAGWVCQPEFAGLTVSQVKAIMHLQAAGRSTVGELADGLGVSISTASETIDRLVESGWFERGVNPENRRQVLVWLAPTGERFAARLYDLRRAQIEAMFARVEPEERPVVVRGLRILAETLQQAPAIDGMMVNGQARTSS